MSDEITRFDLDMDGSMDAFEDGRWVRYDDVEGRIAALEAERDAYKAEANLLEHKVITCGVAASHSDANLAHTGAYAGKWDSAQAMQVRALRAERDALRASVDQLADTLKNVHEAVCATLGIEGDDSLPELVADWVESDLAALRSVSDAAENLVKVKGRFHSEQAYQRLVAAIAAKEA